MDIQSRKIEFIKDFLQLQSEQALVRFEKLLRLEKLNDKDLKQLSIEELNDRIDQSVLDYEQGNIVSSMELQEEMAQWNIK